MKRRILLTALLSVVAAGLGWWGGSRQVGKSGYSRGAAEEPSGTRFIPERKRPENRGGTAGTRVDEVKERLVRLYRTHPDPRLDWRLKEETRRLLEELTVEELEELFLTSASGDIHLMKEILAAWARKDGPVAIRGVLKTLPNIGGLLAHEAFAAWAQNDVEAAMAWLDQGEFPLANKEVADTIRLNFVREYAIADFERALREMVRFEGKDRQHLLVSWATAGEEHPHIAEGLAAYLAEHPEDRMAALKGKVSGMAAKDPSAALEYLSTQEVTQEQREVLDLQVALEQERGTGSANLYQTWLERNPQIQNLPEEFWSSFQWSFTVRQEDMVKWMDGLQEGPVRDQIYERSIRLLAARSSFDKAAVYTEAITDPALKSEAITTLSERWHAADPVKAKAWQDRLK